MYVFGATRTVSYPGFHGTRSVIYQSIYLRLDVCLGLIYKTSDLRTLLYRMASTKPLLVIFPVS